MRRLDVAQSEKASPSAGVKNSKKSNNNNNNYYYYYY